MYTLNNNSDAFPRPCLIISNKNSKKVKKLIKIVHILAVHSIISQLNTHLNKLLCVKRPGSEADHSPTSSVKVEICACSETYVYLNNSGTLPITDNISYTCF
jgi:hypothetical protein